MVGGGEGVAAGYRCAPRAESRAERHAAAGLLVVLTRWRGTRIVGTWVPGGPGRSLNRLPAPDGDEGWQLSVSVGQVFTFGGYTNTLSVR